MDYRFNYQLVGQFLNINSFDKAVIMQCIKTKDYGTMNRYIEGETAPTIEQLLRISNQFQIPLSAWFFNLDRDRDIHIGAPLDDRYTTPLHGYSEGNSKGGPKKLSPVPTRRTAAIIPKMASEKTDIIAILQGKDTTATVPSASSEGSTAVHGGSTVSAKNPHPYTGTTSVSGDVSPEVAELQEQITDLHLSHEKEIDRIKALHDRDLLSEKKRHKKALKEAADRHAAERLQLIDIIKAQQETINRLTRGTKYQEPEQTMQIAAEPEPEPQA